MEGSRQNPVRKGYQGSDANHLVPKGHSENDKPYSMRKSYMQDGLYETSKNYPVVNPIKEEIDHE